MEVLAACGRMIVCLTGLLSATPAHTAQDLLRGIWVGTYTCGQGLTAVTLIVEPEHGDEWSGLFSFGPDKANKAVPEGLYELSITDNSGEISFIGGDWITQPPGYAPVDLRGRMSDDLMVIAGQVDFEGCDAFEVTRQTPLPPLGKTK